MRKNLLDLSGKIDSIKLGAIETIAGIADSQSVPFFIIGAAARDLILTEAYNIRTIRATLDIDFGVRIPNWAQYGKLKKDLVATGEFAEVKEVQRLMYHNSLIIDLIPFGPIADRENAIRWPKEQEIVMHVLGFEESFRHSQTVRLRLNPILEVKIATLAGLAVMKIISWKDGYPERNMDASDLSLIIRSYTDAGNVDRILDMESDLLESEDFDYVSVGARLLGRDIAAILTSNTKEVVLDILNKETGKQDRYKLIEDIMKNDLELGEDFKSILGLLEEMKRGILERP